MIIQSNIVKCIKISYRRREVKNIGGPRFRILGGGARGAKFPAGT